MILRGKYNGAKMSTEALDLHLIIYTSSSFGDKLMSSIFFSIDRLKALFQIEKIFTTLISHPKYRAFGRVYLVFIKFYADEILKVKKER